MSWIDNEVRSIERQTKLPIKNDWRLAYLAALVSSLGILNLLHSSDIQCPNCYEVIEVEVEAKHIPGAGYECDDCGMFYVHGKRCPYCGAKKK